jgi:hypothetical protein
MNRGFVRVDLGKFLDRHERAYMSKYRPAEPPVKSQGIFRPPFTVAFPGRSPSEPQLVSRFDFPTRLG